MLNYFNYFTEIEDYFVRKRGKNILIAPMDWCLVELWKESGIPLHIVLRGIDRSFESAEKRGKSAPTTLYYCHPAILEAWGEHQQARIGAAGESGEAASIPDREHIPAVLEDLLNQLEKCDVPPCRRARERLQALLEDCRSAVPPAEPEIDRELRSLQSALVAELADQIPAERRQKLAEEVNVDLKPYRRRLGSSVLKQLKTRYLERKLLGELGLPEFGLLGR